MTESKEQELARLKQELELANLYPREKIVYIRKLQDRIKELKK